MRFEHLQLASPILRAVATAGYHTPTPIQAQAVPHILAGRDLLGCAQTGTGKTAAFALPILHRLAADANHDAATRPRCLVLCPTRELATQIAGDFKNYAAHLRIRGAMIFGGVGQQPQVAKLRRGVDIIVATPGRLLDLINQKHVDLSRISTLVLDEADRMLDMGFLPDIRRVVACVPDKRQTLMFSATMPAEIRGLIRTWLRDPVKVEIAADQPTADRIDQSVYFVDRAAKPDRLAGLMADLPIHRAIVFTRTKHGADRLVKQLHTRGITALAIHGNKTQNARQRALDHFRQDKVGVLVATDIAARGIDVDGVTHVVNYDITHEPETYVHRIGRTARAGAEGAAISLCDREEVSLLRAIERLLGNAIPVAGGVAPSGAAPTAPRARTGQRGAPRPQGAPRAHRRSAPHPAGRSARSHARPGGSRSRRRRAV